jgi:hypothetical protein
MSSAEQRINELWVQYGSNNVTENDAETGLIETLSALASLDNRNDEDQSPQLQDTWNTLLSWSDEDDIPTVVSTCTCVWKKATVLTATLIHNQTLTPFDVHLHASQALLFLDNNNDKSFVSTFYILLCSWSLRQFPTIPVKRYKRWQSILCETVRLFQELSCDDDTTNTTCTSCTCTCILLWTDIVLPSCLHVKEQLPKEGAYHIGISVALIGTTLMLIEQGCHPVLRRALNDLCIKVSITIEDILHHPWTVFYQQPLPSTNDDDSPILHSNSLAWWTECAKCHDAVSSMDTSWSSLGIALLAYDYCVSTIEHSDNSATTAWDLLFPHHVNTLLLADEQQYQQKGLQLLQKLLLLSSDKDLLVEWQNDTNPTKNDPMGTLQLLSNHLIQAASQHDNKQTTHISNLMQRLVSRYVPNSQLEIVKVLVQQCPYSGLESKLLDLLRPLIVAGTDAPSLWKYLDETYLQPLSMHYVHQGRLQHVEQLLNEAELYVSAVNMVHLHLLLHKNGMPPISSTVVTLDPVLQALKRVVVDDDWGDGEEPPRGFHRIFLLHSTLAEVVKLLGNEY